jgi:hypothetical protein
MLRLDWNALASWLHRTGPELLIIAAVVSAVILFGCAIASWICPSRKKDRIFRRGVM